MPLSKNDIIDIRNARRVPQTLKCHILAARHTDLAIKTALGPSSNLAFESETVLNPDKNAVDQFIELFDNIELTTKNGDALATEQIKQWASLQTRAKAGLYGSNSFSRLISSDSTIVNRVSLAIHESKNCPYFSLFLEKLRKHFHKVSDDQLTESGIFYMSISLTEKAEQLGYGRGHLRSWSLNTEEYELDAKGILQFIAHSLKTRAPVLVHRDETPEPTSPELIALYDELADSFLSLTVLPTGEVKLTKQPDLIQVKVWKKK